MFTFNNEKDQENICFRGRFHSVQMNLDVWWVLHTMRLHQKFSRLIQWRRCWCKFRLLTFVNDLLHLIFRIVAPEPTQRETSCCYWVWFVLMGVKLCSHMMKFNPIFHEPEILTEIILHQWIGFRCKWVRHPFSPKFILKFYFLTK